MIRRIVYATFKNSWTTRAVTKTISYKIPLVQMSCVEHMLRRLPLCLLSFLTLLKFTAGVRRKSVAQGEQMPKVTSNGDGVRKLKLMAETCKPLLASVCDANMKSTPCQNKPHLFNQESLSRESIYLKRQRPRQPEIWS